jgi:heme-degrading monooxygenase HmoA
MIARVNSAQTTPDELDRLVQFAGDRFPDAREAPGFQGFYLLADRQSGKVVSISLWESHEDLQLFQDKGAELRQAASAEAGIAPTPVEVYEVLLQA